MLNCVILEIHMKNFPIFWSVIYRLKSYDSIFEHLTHRNTKTQHNYSNIFIVLGVLKSLLCFPLGIDVNDILNYHTKYLLRKSRKKAIANK